MKTKAIEIRACIVCTPMDDAMGGRSVIHTKEIAIESVLKEVRQRFEKIIPEGMGCTMVVAERIINPEDLKLGE